MTVKTTFRGTKLQPSVDVYSLAKTLLNGGAPVEVRRCSLAPGEGGSWGCRPAHADQTRWTATPTDPRSPTYCRSQRHERTARFPRRRPTPSRRSFPSPDTRR